MHYVLHGLARIFVVSVRITFVYVRAYHPFVSVSIRHSERSEEFFSVLLCAPLCSSVPICVICGAPLRELVKRVCSLYV